MATAKARMRQAAPSVITGGRTSIGDDHVLRVLLGLGRVLGWTLRDQAVALGHECAVLDASGHHHLAAVPERVWYLAPVANRNRRLRVLAIGDPEVELGAVVLNRSRND